MHSVTVHASAFGEVPQRKITANFNSDLSGFVTIQDEEQGFRAEIDGAIFKAVANYYKADLIQENQALKKKVNDFELDLTSFHWTENPESWSGVLPKLCDLCRNGYAGVYGSEYTDEGCETCERNHYLFDNLKAALDRMHRRGGMFALRLMEEKQSRIKAERNGS